jgi:hypothetical protein
MNVGGFGLVNAVLELFKMLLHLIVERFRSDKADRRHVGPLDVQHQIGKIFSFVSLVQRKPKLIGAMPLTLRRLER